MALQLCQIYINGEFVCDTLLTNNGEICVLNIEGGVEVTIDQQENICRSILKLYQQYTNLRVVDMRVFPPIADSDAGAGTDTRFYYIENDRIESIFNSSWSNLMRLFPQCAFQFNIIGITRNLIG